uniref:dUTP diphosphatase n=1 Tax=Megaviridae environmental sample TaxID=1737588 RepID=A0A5J6VIR2_9VIRU|nr:MAG: dUTPase [Megaviridae environmental sample]
MKLYIQLDTNCAQELDHMQPYYWEQTHLIERMERGDSGLDLVTPCDYVCLANETVAINLKIRCQPYFKDGVRRGYYLYPRSSIAKTPLRMANSVGIIDWGYRGNIIAKFHNTSNEEYVVEAGTRLVQLCSHDLTPIDIDIVDNVEDSIRGDGGFGSTGV